MDSKFLLNQAMAVAQKGVKLCGPATRQLLKETSTTATWHGYLMKNIIGPQYSHYNRYLRQYSELGSLTQAAWESAGLEAGLHPIEVEYANAASVSAGAQLFILAAALYDLGLYAVGQPGANAEEWRERVVE